MFVNFNEEIRKILKLSQIQRDELNHPYIGSEHLFLAMLKDSKLIQIFKNNNINYKSFKEELINLVGIGKEKSKFVLYTPLLKKIIENVVIEAHEHNNKIINSDVVILAILEEENSVAYNILKKMNINIDKLYFDIRKKKNIRLKKRKLLIEELGVNLNNLSKDKKIDPVIGREKEINSLIEVLLRRKKNNPILIGPAGVGKTAIVEGVANLIESDNCPVYLKDKKIIALDIFSIVSGTKYRGEFEEKMKNIIKELEDNQEIILFIDEIHTIVGAGGAEGAIDASNILKPALARGSIKVIGATTINEYKKYIEPDAALTRRFQKIIIKEPDKNSVVEILTKIKPLYEKYHNITISNIVIKKIVDLSHRYLSNRYEPDKSIDILDELCVKTSLKNNYENEKLIKLNKIKVAKKNAIVKKQYNIASKLKDKENILIKEIDKIIKRKKEVKIEDVLDIVKKKGNIINPILSTEECKVLKKKLDDKIIGQEDNKNKVIRAIAKKNLLNIKEPCSILISAKEGYGKTFFAETLLKSLKIEDVIKIDLSEYKESYTLSKLIGTTAGYSGYDNKNNIFENIKINASSGLLIKNYEDACTEIKNLFNKILEDGYIEDASGSKIDFTNCIIIFVNNINVEKEVGFNKNEITNEENTIKNVTVSIELDNLTNEQRETLIKRKVKEELEKYNDLKVTIDKNYCKNLNEKFKHEKNIKKIVLYIQEEINQRVLDNILSNNSIIDIKC